MRQSLIFLLLMASMSFAALGFTSEPERRIDCTVLTAPADLQTIGVLLTSEADYQFVMLHNKGHGGDLQLIGETHSYTFDFEQYPMPVKNARPLSENEKLTPGIRAGPFCSLKLRQIKKE